MSAVRQISRDDSVQLVIDVWIGAEEEVTRLRELMVVHFCDCPKLMIGRPDHTEHVPACRYRKMVRNSF